MAADARVVSVVDSNDVTTAEVSVVAEERAAQVAATASGATPVAEAGNFRLPPAACV